MCNYRREDATDIGKKGTGFKIVSVNVGGGYEAPFHINLYKRHNVWDEKYSYLCEISGFCFLRTFSDAFMLKERLSCPKKRLHAQNCIICEIEYSGGICSQEEYLYDLSYTSCLCKEFTFIDYPSYLKE